MIIVNFSHPLNDEAKDLIRVRYGAGDAEFIRVHVQVDVESPLRPQVELIVSQAAGGNPLNIDCIILPGLAPVAVLVARMLPHANIIRLAARGTPPVFMPVELIRPR